MDRSREFDNRLKQLEIDINNLTLKSVRILKEIEKLEKELDSKDVKKQVNGYYDEIQNNKKKHKNHKKKSYKLKK